MLVVGEGVYLVVLLVEEVYGGCQPAPVAIFTGNKPKHDALNSNKMERRLLRVKSPPLLCLELIFGFGEGERWGAERETVPSYASAAGASARNDARRGGDARQMLIQQRTRAPRFTSFNAALCGSAYVAVGVLH